MVLNCAGETRKRDVTTMFTYSHANTPLGQSERAYYLSYFIINCILIKDKRRKENDSINPEIILYKKICIKIM